MKNSHSFLIYYFKNYEENAAYPCVAKTRLNARINAIINFTSKLAVIFFRVTLACLIEILRYKISFSRKFSPKNKKTYFLAPKWGSTYTWD